MSRHVHTRSAIQYVPIALASVPICLIGTFAYAQGTLEPCYALRIGDEMTPECRDEWLGYYLRSCLELADVVPLDAVVLTDERAEGAVGPFELRTRDQEIRASYMRMLDEQWWLLLDAVDAHRRSMIGSPESRRTGADRMHAVANRIVEVSNAYARVLSRDLQEQGLELEPLDLWTAESMGLKHILEKR